MNYNDAINVMRGDQGNTNSKSFVDVLCIVDQFDNPDTLRKLDDWCIRMGVKIKYLYSNEAELTNTGKSVIENYMPERIIYKIPDFNDVATDHVSEAMKVCEYVYRYKSRMIFVCNNSGIFRHGYAGDIIDKFNAVVTSEDMLTDVLLNRLIRSDASANYLDELDNMYFVPDKKTRTIIDTFITNRNQKVKELLSDIGNAYDEYCKEIRKELEQGNTYPIHV